MGTSILASVHEWTRRLIRPRTDQRDVAVLGDDGGGKWVIGGAAVVGIVRKFGEEFLAELAAESGLSIVVRKAKHIHVVVADGLRPSDYLVEGRPRSGTR